MAMNFPYLDKPGLSYVIGKIKDKFVRKTDIATNLTTQDDTKVLSAKQGYLLNENKVDKAPKNLGDFTTREALNSALQDEVEEMGNNTNEPIMFKGGLFAGNDVKYYGTLSKAQNQWWFVNVTSTSEICYGATKGIIGTVSWERYVIESDILTRGTEQWMEAPTYRTTSYHYENANTGTYNLPYANIDVTVTKHSIGRGIAIATVWSNVRTPRIWFNRLHGTWQGWKAVACDPTGSAIATLTSTTKTAWITVNTNESMAVYSKLMFVFRASSTGGMYYNELPVYLLEKASITSPFIFYTKPNGYSDAESVLVYKTSDTALHLYFGTYTNINSVEVYAL